jgi:uncharacterized C2H2 Zn-finger protein
VYIHLIAEERPFQCERCGKVFKRVDHLNNHKACR